MHLGVRARGSALGRRRLQQRRNRVIAPGARRKPRLRVLALDIYKRGTRVRQSRRNIASRQNRRMHRFELDEFRQRELRIIAPSPRHWRRCVRKAGRRDKILFVAFECPGALHLVLRVPDIVFVDLLLVLAERYGAFESHAASSDHSVCYLHLVLAFVEKLA